LISKRNLSRLRKIVEATLERQLYTFDSKKPHIPLMIPSYASDEVLGAIDTLLSTQVTMGEKVFKFEEEFARYIGCKHGVMVNSGSSANLVAFSTLCNPLLKSSIKSPFEAIIPAVTWSTTLFPVINCGGKAVLCDVAPDTFLLTNEAVEHAQSGSTRLLVPVHLLGNPCNVSQMRGLVEDKQVRVVEDACEAHGAEISGKKVGSFGDLGTFSFFFSHHITTMEGGMVVTDNEEYAEIARMLRAHGWIRELRRNEEFASRYPSIDRRFLFVNTGYNLRPTEIEGAFGLYQIKKLEHFIEARRVNARYLSSRLKNHEHIRLQTERPGTRHVWFGYPVTVAEEAPFSREQLTSFLEKKGIETRPIMAGNLAEQPAISLVQHRNSGKLTNSERIMKQSFFFGIHQGLNREALDYIVSCFEDFFRGLK
jgi:CDP-6-deoxy-D-xylo-4-hexulose-3-dehydrase